MSTAATFTWTGPLPAHKSESMTDKTEALVCAEPGRLEYRQIEKPAPADGRALIKINRIGVCGTDLHAFEGTQPYFQYPRILGHELSGELIDAGGASGFETGEAVTFIPYFSCGQCIACRNGKGNCCERIEVFGVHIDGGMTGYVSVPASTLVHGNGLSFDELALVEPLAIGAHGVSRAGVRQGEFVLVVGAGPIGLGIMELARIAGGQVIAMDVNEKRLAFCRKNLQIPYTVQAGEDAGKQLKAITGGDMPTVVVDATGSQAAINNAFRYLAHGGRYVLVGLQKNAISFSHPEFHKREATLMSSRNATRADFEKVIDCMKQGKVDPAAYITHRLPFNTAKDRFSSLLKPESGVIKALIEY